MLNKRHVILCFLVFCLTATLLVGVTSSVPYDSWRDIYPDGDGDGVIDIMDILELGVRFGEEGTPINKTALLLGVQEGICLLNMSIGEHGLRLDDAEARLDDVEADIADLIARGHYISVPAGAFVRKFYDDYTTITGGTLVNLKASTAAFLGAVQLPHGATVTNFTTYWYDDNASNVYCWLRRRYSTGGYVNLASAPSSGTSGVGSSYDDTIFYATVDNSQYGYCVEVEIPASDSHLDYLFNLAIIEYEYPS